MNIYLDTSLLVAALTPEGSTQKIQRWLAAATTGTLYISDWTQTEFASALAMKVRTKALSLDDRALVQTCWKQLLNDSLVLSPITRRCFEAAANYVADAASGLRAGDALHLAIAAENGLHLATLDKLLANAASKHGVPVVNRF